MSESAAIHVWPIRVYYEDTDSEGIVYYANYLKFAERGRTEMLRAAGIVHPRLLEKYGVLFAVRNLSAEYLRPAKLDDALAIHTRLTEIRGASMCAEQIVRRSDEELVRITVRLACIARDGKPARLPRSLRATLGAFQCDA
jgi:acyl-CoA thioester hydrolase